MTYYPPMGNETCSDGISTSQELFKLLLQYAYAIPACVLYVAIIVIIFRKEKSLANSFFWLYAVDCIVSVLVVTVDFAFMRPIQYLVPLCKPLLDIFRYPSYVLTPYYALIGYLTSMKMLCTWLLSINRFTCVVFPFTHKRSKKAAKLQLWDEYIWKFVGLAVVLPVVVVWPVLVSETYLVPIPGEAGLGFDYTHKIRWASTSMNKFFLLMTTTLVVAVCNGTSVITIVRMRNAVTKADASLCIATAFLALGAFLAGINQLPFFLVKNPAEHYEFMIFVFRMTFFISDFSIVSSPFIMLMMTKALRTRILGLVGLRKRTSVSVSDRTVSVIRGSIISSF